MVRDGSGFNNVLAISSNSLYGAVLEVAQRSATAVCPRRVFVVALGHQHTGFYLLVVSRTGRDSALPTQCDGAITISRAILHCLCSSVELSHV